MAMNRIFGHAKMTYRGTDEPRPIDECCVGRKLMPRWRGPEVMEDDALAMGFVCHACGREFLPSDVEGRYLIRGGGAPAPVAAAPAAAAAAAAEVADDEVTEDEATEDEATEPAEADGSESESDESAPDKEQTS